MQLRLVKQIKRKKKELYEKLSKILFQNQDCFEAGTSTINASSLQAIQSELKRFKFSQGKLASTRDNESIISNIWLELKFLCYYFRLPSISEFRTCFGLFHPGSEIEVVDLGKRELSLLLKTWLLLVNLFNHCEKYTRIIQLFQEGDADFNQEVRLFFLQELGQEKIGAFEQKSRSAKLSEEDKHLLEQWKHIIPNKQVLDRIAFERSLFAEIATIQEKMLGARLELTGSRYCLLDLLDKYDIKVNRIEFIALLRNLSREEANRSFISEILYEGLKLEHNAESFNIYLLQKLAQNSDSEKEYRILRKIFLKNEDLLCFLFKALFAKENIKDLLNGLFKALNQAVSFTEQVSEIDLSFLLEECRSKLLAIFPADAKVELLPRLKFFEKAYSSNASYCLRIYLHLSLLPTADIYKLILEDFVLAIYKYLNDKFGQFFGGEEFEELDVSLLAFLKKDEVFQALFDGSTKYILEECGGLPYVAHKFKAKYFAYPRYIINALIATRLKEFLARDGSVINLDKLGLMQCITYNFKETQVFSNPSKASISDKSLLSFASFSPCVISSPAERKLSSDTQRSSFLNPKSHEVELAQFLSNPSSVSSGDERSNLHKTLLLFQQELLRIQFEKISDISQCQAMLAKVGEALAILAEESTEVRKNGHRSSK